MHLKPSQVYKILPILFVSFIGNFGLTIVVPFLAFLVFDMGGSIILYGLILALYPVGQAIGAPILGHWADKKGRVPVLFLSNLGTTLSWLIFLIALFVNKIELFELKMPFMYQGVQIIEDQKITLPILLIAFSRAFDGLTGGNVAIASSYLADMSTDKDRSDNFNLMTIALNLGLICGPTLGGILVLTPIGSKTPIIAALIISVIATVSVPLLLKKDIIGEQYVGTKTNIEGLRVYMKKNNIYLLFLLFFTIMLNSNIFITVVPAFAVKALGWNEQEVGHFFGFVMLGAVISMLTINPILNKKFKDSVIVIFGVILLIPMFFIPLSNGKFSLYFLGFLVALGNSLVWPALSTIIAHKGGSKYQGKIQGIITTIGAISAIIGLSIGGVFYDVFDEKVFYLGGVIVIIILLLSVINWLQERKVKMVL